MSDKKKTALAVIRDPSDQKFVLVKVSFTTEDPNVEVVLKDVREDVIDRFKMLASDTFMGDNVQ